MSQCSADRLVPPASGKDAPSATWAVPPIFSSKATLRGALLDLVVHAEGDLAQVARAVVHVQHPLQELTAAAGLVAHHASVLEPQPHAAELAAVVGGVEAEADVPARQLVPGAGEHLAVGEVLAAVGVHPRAAGHVDHQVGVLGDDPQLPHRASRSITPAWRADWLAPERHRVGVVEVAGAEHELLEVGERHARVLGVRRGRQRDPAPADLAGGDALEEAVGQRRRAARPAAPGGQAAPRSGSGCSRRPRSSASCPAPPTLAGRAR